MESAPLKRFRLIIALVTVLLVTFVMWISEGVTLGRWIAGGVIVLGFLQWWVLGRLVHQVEAKSSSKLDREDGNR
jgi:hypothetical protein